MERRAKQDWLEHRGSEFRTAGYYWNLSTGEFIAIPQGGGLLPDAKGRYLKIPGPFMPILAPVLGGLFIIFLPLIGIVLVIGLVLRRLAQALGTGGRGLLVLLSAPRWVPGRSYLATWAGKFEERVGEPPHRSKEAETFSSLIDELEKEIAAKRQEETKEQ